jgi:hypothetical protein
MKKIKIICEGNTEIEFCHKVLKPYFADKNISILTTFIDKSGGGIVSWTALKRQIEWRLRDDTTMFISTFIDYYGIPDKYGYPKWQESKKIVNKSKRVDFLEDAMKNAIHPALVTRFVPYIQLHEFEALLFNNIEAFTAIVPAIEFADKPALIRTIEEHPNGEHINDTRQNSPSNRLDRIFNSYNKVFTGPRVAERIGIPNIRARNPRFDAWLTKLEK